jgi:hypothetical protein
MLSVVYAESHAFYYFILSGIMLSAVMLGVVVPF